MKDVEGIDTEQVLVLERLKQNQRQDYLKVRNRYRQDYLKVRNIQNYLKVRNRII